MKKTLTLLGLIPALASAQSLVNTTPENRTVLLEDFTGIHCGYCPEGHVIMAALEERFGPRYVGVGVHAGGFAVPQGNEPDFRTDEGTAIDAHFTISGYPAGVINRHLFDGEDDLGRGSWEGAVEQVLDMPSPVNLGVESSYDAGTQTLTVHTHALYTGDSPSGNDYISVLVTESHIIGYQADYTNGTHQNYDHLHVLRGYLTDTWGEDVGNHVAGETVDRTYTMAVPPEWNIANCEVVAFISEYQTEVYQARDVAADGGTTLVIGSMAGNGQPYRPGQDGTATPFDGTFTNLLNADAQYTITLTGDDAPGSWTAGINVDGQDLGNPATVTVTNGATINVTANITPDAAPGIGDYTLSITSVSNSSAPAISTEYHVISGVHDLIVTHSGAEAHEPIYMNAMYHEPAKAATSKAKFVAFAQADALAGVNNLYVNVSWTFPSLTDDEVAVLAAFMDNGGNLMIAGQDIGWDQSGADGAYGTPATQAFYADHLLADFMDDGSTADNTVNFEDADAVFGTLSNSAVNNVFSTNTYPDRIDPIDPAVPILRYTNPDKIGGLRAEVGNHKVVYFGIGPEQMSNTEVGRGMVQLSHDWFYGIVSVEEFDAAMADLGRPYPSPTTDVLNLDVSSVHGATTLEVFDASGRLMLTQAVANNAGLATLHVGSLANGVYSVRARGPQGTGAARAFNVLH